MGERTGSQAAESTSVGPYRIEAPLGKGGMGAVFLALHEVTGARVALKLIPRELESNREAMRRFRREFSSCLKIDHPNVIRVIESGVADGLFYYAMEYLPHPSLRVVMAKEAPFDEGRVLRYLGDVCSAFACYHPLGLVHRDLKPENLIVAAKDRIVIVDFGLVHDSGVTQLTATGELLGTPYYMAPEQWKGLPATAATDQFQLGLIAYEMLSARKAFDGDSPSAISIKCLDEPPLPLETLRQKLTPRLGAFVTRCLAKNPSDRYADASAMLADLYGIQAEPVGGGARRRQDRSRTKGASGQGSASRRKEVQTGARTPVAEGVGNSTSDVQVTEQGRNVRVWLLVGMAAILVVVAAALWLTIPKRNYSAMNLRAVEGIRAVVITWSSETPYCGRVEIRHHDGTVTLHKGGGRETGLHRVVIKGLRPGRKYGFKVIYPDDRGSIGQSFRLSPFRPRPRRIAVAVSELVATFSTSLPVRCTMSVGFCDGTTGSAEGGPPGLEHELHFPLDGGRVDHLAVMAVSLAGDSEETDLGKLLLPLVRSSSSLMRFDPRKLLNSVGFDLSPMATVPNEIHSGKSIEVPQVEVDRRRLAIQKILIEKLKTGGHLAARRRVEPFVPFLLDHAIVPREARQALYEAFTSFLVLRGTMRKWAIRGMELLDVDLGRHLARGGLSFRPTRRVPLGSQSGFHMMAYKFRIREKPRYPDKKSFSFNVGDTGRVTRVALGFYAPLWKTGAYLIVRFNGGGGRVIHYVGESSPVRIELEPEGLVGGVNRLDLSIKDVPGRYAADEIFIKNLAVFVKERARR